MKDGAVSRSIKGVLPMVGNEESHVYVKTFDEADLVIFTEVRDIERGYSKEKAYAYLQTSKRDTPHLPENCRTVGCSLLELVYLIADVRKTLKPPEAPKTELVIPEVPLRLDAPRILVIEDTPKHQASARAGLAGHKLTIATGYEEAMKILANEKFDIVLTDLLMPMSSQTLGPDAFKLGELVPYGLLLKDEAAHQGATHVAVVTDLNHHTHWVAAAFDHFRYLVRIDGAKVLMMHAPMNADGTKDWAQALADLMEA